MIDIVYECNVYPNECAVTVYYTHRFHARGNTPAEVEADCKAQILRLKAFNVQAVGLHNYRDQWEAAFGPSDYPDTAFRPHEVSSCTGRSRPRWWLWPLRGSR